MLSLPISISISFSRFAPSAFSHSDALRRKIFTTEQRSEPILTFSSLDQVCVHYSLPHKKNPILNLNLDIHCLNLNLELSFMGRKEQYILWRVMVSLVRRRSRFGIGRESFNAANSICFDQAFKSESLFLDALLQGRCANYSNKHYSLMDRSANGRGVAHCLPISAHTQNGIFCIDVAQL